ncbi:hypothetical protein JHK87_044197 [Glycine soja]|nr:hypothetical protein JHK87_044197 [Glycine soja]
MMSISSADQIEILRVVRRVAGTNINRGMAFFTCSINKDEVGYCGYFIWVDQLIEALGVDDSLGTFSMEQRRQFGREEDKTMWKAQVNSKLDCMGIEMKMFRIIVYGMFLIQLLSMVVFVYVSRRPPNWIPPPPDEDVTPLIISCPMPRCQLVMMTFMQLGVCLTRHGTIFPG